MSATIECPRCNNVIGLAYSDPEQLAKRFHELYEQLAPKHAYKTRKDSAVKWEDVPEKNRSLMIAVCEKILEGALSHV